MRFTIKFQTEGRFAGKYALMDDGLVGDTFDTAQEAVDALYDMAGKQEDRVTDARNAVRKARRELDDVEEELDEILADAERLHEQLQLEQADR